MSGAALPNPPVLGSPYDPDREAALIKAVAELQKGFGDVAGVLANTQPSLITDRFGRVWEVLARAFGYDPRQSHPFEIIDRSENPSELKFSVSKFSRFMKSPNVSASNTITITNLETVKTAVAGNWVWMACTVAGNEITAIDCVTGASWANYPEIYTWGGSAVTYVYIPIAYFKAIDSTEHDNEYLPGDTLSHGASALQVVQLARNHIMALHICSGTSGGSAPYDVTRNIPYGMPWFGPDLNITF